MHTFFKMATFSFKKRMLGCKNPLHLPTLTVYPTPTLGDTPNFFHQNERQGRKIDYLTARGQLLFRFNAAVKKLEEGCNNPLVRRGLISMNIMFQNRLQTVPTCSSNTINISVNSYSIRRVDRGKIQYGDMGNVGYIFPNMHCVPSIPYFRFLHQKTELFL